MFTLCASTVSHQVKFLLPLHLMFIIAYLLVLCVPNNHFLSDMERCLSPVTSRDMLMALRHTAPRLNNITRQKVKLLGCARRGCRGGRHVKERMKRGLIEPTSDRREVQEIQVLLTHRRLPKDTMPTARQSRRYPIQCTLQPVDISTKSKHQGTGLSIIPTIYVLNPTSLAKANAIEQLTADFFHTTPILS